MTNVTPIARVAVAVIMAAVARTSTARIGGQPADVHPPVASAGT